MAMAHEYETRALKLLGVSQELFAIEQTHSDRVPSGTVPGADGSRSCPPLERQLSLMRKPYLKRVTPIALRSAIRVSLSPKTED
jgi:hypothetical protein